MSSRDTKAAFVYGVRIYDLNLNLGTSLVRVKCPFQDNMPC